MKVCKVNVPLLVQELYQEMWNWDIHKFAYICLFLLLTYCLLAKQFVLQRKKKMAGILFQLFLFGMSQGYKTVRQMKTTCPSWSLETPKCWMLCLMVNSTLMNYDNGAKEHTLPLHSPQIKSSRKFLGKGNKDLSVFIKHVIFTNATQVIKIMKTYIHIRGQRQKDLLKFHLQAPLVKGPLCPKLGYSTWIWNYYNSFCNNSADVWKRIKMSIFLFF